MIDRNRYTGAEGSCSSAPPRSGLALEDKGIGQSDSSRKSVSRRARAEKGSIPETKVCQQAMRAHVCQARPADRQKYTCVGDGVGRSFDVSSVFARRRAGQSSGLGGEKEVKLAGEARIRPTTGAFEAGQKQALWHTLSHPCLKVEGCFP
jgi:hypothetical protein